MLVAKDKALDPLSALLGDVIGRLEVLESKVGVAAPAATTSAAAGAPKPSAASLAAAGGEVASVKAYDAYMKSCVAPFAAACDDVGMGDCGKLVVTAWEGVRSVLVLVSRSKQCDLTQLTPFLAPTQDAIKSIRALKLDRSLDSHLKAVTELCGAPSWLFMQPPAQLPAAFVKETLGSSDFWANRIRKEHKGGDSKQIAFCDALKGVLTGLVEYIEAHHKTGLTFNPRGVSLAEAAIVLSDEPASDLPTKSPKQRHPTLGNVVVGGNVAGLMGELQLRKSADGSSAATGLKHVTKDQQTWRKEFKKETTKTVTLPAAPSLEPTKKKEKKKPLLGLPIFEYQERGFKWVIENHTKESVIKEASKDGVITVEITDPKEQVYLYNCEGITVRVNGKFKSLVLDKCEKCAVVYDTLISSAEMVNCKKIQLQVTGVCPVFTIDKTCNVLIWLSKESKDISTFTTSLSSEMNVSFPDGDDQKELPIPEQFVHALKDGSLTSDVSDLYH